MNTDSRPLVPDRRQVRDNTDLTHRIYFSIKQEILVGKLPIREKLSVVRLAEQYHVSRTPVTQALELLKKDGLVEQLPGKRAVVKPLSPHEISIIYMLRRQLEPSVAVLSLDVIPRYEVLRLREKVAYLREYPDLREESVRTDERIHSMLWRYLDDPMVSSVFSTINEYSVRLQSFTTYSIKGSSGNCDEHLRILDAIIAKDSGETYRAVEDHLLQSCQRLLAFCQDQ